MNPDRTRWGDSRLDDAFVALRAQIAEVINEVRALRSLPTEIAKLSLLADRHYSDVNACHRAVRELRDDFNAYTEEQAETHEAHRLERKSDRRWMVGTVLTSAALVIGAMGLLLGHLG